MNHHFAKLILLAIIFAGISACASNVKDSGSAKAKSEVAKAQIEPSVCDGEVVAPAVFAPLLTEVDRPELVTASLGSAGTGGLCQAKAYKVTQPFEIYRAWNSRKPYSKLGHWWSFSMPSGKIAQYREKYAICPKYSPLDMMVRCSLQEGSIVVLGTGQSASCNAFDYPASSAIQLYVADAAQVTEGCQSFYGVFSWQNVNKNPKTKTEEEEPAAADDSF